MADREQLEQELMLREELAARQSTDALWKWDPTPKQEPFVRDLLSGAVDEAYMICANRAGKSDAAAYVGATLARFGRINPKWSIGYGGIAIEDVATAGWVISVDYPNSRDVIQPKYFNNGASVGSHEPFIPKREIKGWSVTDQLLKLKNGSLIGFKSADTKAIKFAGAERDWVQFDEESPKVIHNEATTRVAAGRKLVVFGAMTLLPPEGQVGGVTWMFDDYIKPWQRTPTACRFKLYSASIYDNPHLLPDEIARLESKYPAGSVERRIRLDGEWLPGLSGARAYVSFDARLHVRPQGDIIERRPICWIWDFNVDPMVSLIGQRDGKIFRVFKELILEPGSVDEMVQYFHEQVPMHHGEVWVYGDATGKNRTAQTARSYYTLIQNGMRSYGAPVRIKVRDSNPQVPDRINALNRQFKDENGELNIEIDPSCKELIDDCEQVLRDARGGIKKTHNRRDPYFRRTHLSDALGYWVSYEEPVRLSVAQRVVRAIKSPAYGFREVTAS